MDTNNADKKLFGGFIDVKDKLPECTYNGKCLEELDILLRGGAVVSGYFSQICGFSKCLSFYTECLIDNDRVEAWRYKKRCKNAIRKDY